MTGSFWPRQTFNEKRSSEQPLHKCATENAEK